jgi:hypothetical protein
LTLPAILVLRSFLVPLFNPIQQNDIGFDTCGKTHALEPLDSLGEVDFPDGHR